VTKDEVEQAVGQCGSTKSLGPDGFNFNFIKKNWDTIGDEFIKSVLSFFELGFIPRRCNVSFVALIPKRENPMSLHDFRPISLVGCVYKVITKILANRIKNVLPSIIDIHQSAFIGGRGLLDNVLVATEVVNFMKRGKKSGVLFNVDFEKAYDSVDWKFLYYMMGRLGFNERWIKWIRACLESATLSILVNGSPTDEFKPKRGLRQGDPLTPFLFLIVAEGMTGLVREASRKKLLEGIEVGYRACKYKFSNL